MPEDFSDLESKLTDTARASLERAGVLAHTSGSSYIGTEHVLLGVLAQNTSLGAKILAQSGVTLDRTETALDLTAKAFVVVMMHKGLSTDVLETIRTAWQLAIEFGQERIGTEHLIYSIILQRDARATKLLSDMNVDLEALRGDLEEVFDKQQSEAIDTKSGTNTQKAGELKILEKFGHDLTAQAHENLLDPVVGRSDELKRMITILGRRSKNNPALIGEPGVGKTAVVEGLAQKIVDGDVPANLIGKRIIQLDLASMVAGTKYRGQFEERLQKVLEVLKKHQEIILFIDELHLLVGAGSAEGSMDASNILKPALARGEVRVIGATTFDEYRKHVEKDAALARRFQAVIVREPSVMEAVKMVSSLASRLASHHQVVIDDDSIAAAVNLSERYITERQLPDKAIDVLDEAASLLRSETPIKDTKRQKLARQIKQMAAKIDAAVESEDYERAAACKQQLVVLEKSATKINAKLHSLPLLHEHYLRRAVAAMTGVPVERLGAHEAKSLIGLERRLAKTVLGQKEAVEQLARTIRRARSGLARRSGPLGSFVFLGPTGVGKTELARVLAREVFGGDSSLIKIDMSEFGEKHTASRLVGAPAGYVGYEDGGKLTDKIRRQPYSVVLFDEIEKAHPDVMNLLLQLLEDGTLTDAQGRSVSFKNSIIILTSNVGAQRMVREAELGFASKKITDKKLEDVHQRNSRAAIQELEDFMRPELIGRFDSVVTFRALTRPIVSKIFDLFAKELVDAVGEQGLKLEISPPLKRRLIDEGFDEQRGARVLRNTVQTKLGDPLSDALLAGGLKKGAILKAVMREGKVVINVEQP